MRSILISLVAVMVLAGAAVAAEEKVASIEGVLIDIKCGTGKMDKEDPEADAAKHAKGCAIKCASSGYSVVDGKTMLKFDDNGNKLAAEYLARKETTTKVIVEGTITDDKIAVTSIKPQEPAKQEPAKEE